MPRGRLALGDQAGLLEVLEVAADGRGGQAEVVGQRGGGDRAPLADRLEHPVAGARLEHQRARPGSADPAPRGRRGGGPDIHNTDVT